MADEEGPQAPVTQGAHDPPAQQNPPPPQKANNPIIPKATQAPEAPHPFATQMPPLNRSHFKQEYSGKPDEYAEAHLLRINN